MNAKVPSDKTLAKYGLSFAKWDRIATAQNDVCAVCKKLPNSGRLVIDHEHAPKWSKMPPEKRRLYVRGLLCYFCNRYFLARGATVQKMLDAAEYLKQYQERRDRT